ncbi:MAG: NAD(P)H-dependent oxidoreductase [Rhodospirillales bacterium]|nr:MAG: NAD(P)H-dependent oxidoreductase [Rhodospirillales bacterium]
MSTIIGLSGSLRKGSYNAALLAVAAEVAPDDCTVAVESIAGIPLYDADLEAAGAPVPVTELQEKLDAADGLLLVSPEYNQSIPGVFKNAIDWLSSFPLGGDKIFRDLPVGLIGASPSWSGTINAQTAWLPVFRGLAMKPFLGETLYVGEVRGKFDEDRNLTDSALRDRLTHWMAKFAAFVAAETKQG